MNNLIKSNCCENHPDQIFGYNIMETIEEWLEEETLPLFQCIHYHLIVVEWEAWGCKIIQDRGYYPLLKELVYKHRVSGTLYRGTDYELDKLKVGFVLDYNRLESWSREIKTAHLFAEIIPIL